MSTAISILLPTLASSPLEASPFGIGIWVIVTFALLFLLLYFTFIILWVRASLAGRQQGPV